MVSVVVPTRDRPTDLEPCLKSLLALDYPNFEIVVVDQSKDDAGEQLCARLADPRLHCLRTNTVGRSRGANLGVALAKGEIIAFTDDDCTVPAEWLQRVTQVLANEPKAGVYYGAVKAAPHDEAESLVPIYTPPVYKVFDGKLVHAAVIGMGANMVVRRNVFARVGGFDPLMGVGSKLRSGEDWELTYRALRAGFAVVEDPESPITHYGAREYANGRADRLFMSYLFGHGAGYLLNARRGDLSALWLFFREFYLSVAESLGNVVRGRRPIGFRRVMYLVYGGLVGVLSRTERPVDLSIQGA